MTRRVSFRPGLPDVPPCYTGTSVATSVAANGRIIVLFEEENVLDPFSISVSQFFSYPNRSYTGIVPFDNEQPWHTDVSESEKRTFLSVNSANRLSRRIENFSWKPS